MDDRRPGELLDNVADLLSGGTPRKSNPIYWDGSIPWLTPRDMGRWSGATGAAVSRAAIGSGTRLAPREATFIAVRGMSLHKEIRVIRPGEAMTFNQDIKAVVARKGIDPLYLHYAIVSKKPELLNAVEAAGHGTGRLPTDTLKGLHIPRFQAPTEAALAEFFGALDRRIGLNRHIIETLEAMARAVFKDWFVDFGPTRAKAEGREPYIAAELWDSFPDSIDDQEKPAGWDVRKLEDILKLNYGKSLPARKRMPGNVAVYGSGGIVGTHDSALIEGPAVIVGRKGTVGSLFWEDGPVFPIDTVFFVEPRVGSVLFAYHLLASLPLRDMNTDAAVPGLNRNNAYRLEVPLPSPELISAFEYIGRALWNRRAKSLMETKTLAQIRDLLLPKLMSGEIRLDEAEKAVEEAVM